MGGLRRSNAVIRHGRPSLHNGRATGVAHEFELVQKFGYGLTVPIAYLNARADECAAIGKEREERIVRYRGRAYTVIGYYLSSGGGERELCYVLRGLRRFARTEVVL